MTELEALSAISTCSTRSSPAASRRATAPVSAGALDAPAITATPAARAASSSAPMPQTNARASARSKYGMPASMQARGTR